MSRGEESRGCGVAVVALLHRYYVLAITLVLGQTIVVLKSIAILSCR